MTSWMFWDRISLRGPCFCQQVLKRNVSVIYPKLGSYAETFCMRIVGQPLLEIKVIFE